jgi:hypothetical protein
MLPLPIAIEIMGHDAVEKMLQDKRAMLQNDPILNKKEIEEINQLLKDLKHL